MSLTIIVEAILWENKKKEKSKLSKESVPFRDFTHQLAVEVPREYLSEFKYKVWFFFFVILGFTETHNELKKNSFFIYLKDLKHLFPVENQNKIVGTKTIYILLVADREK